MILNMKIIIAGYGFYVLGDQDCNGGTILPSLYKWSILSPNNKIELVCLTKSEESKLSAKERFNKFINKYNNNENISFEFIHYEDLEKIGFCNCAIVAIPERYHYECIMKIFPYTNNILCVKPCTDNLNDLNMLIEEANIHSKKIYIDFHKRFDQSNLKFIKEASSNNSKFGVFNFTYGQKTVMPKTYFKKWAKLSNPFQYLAPHYIDIIFLILSNKKIKLDNINISGDVQHLCFEDNPDLISLVSCNLKLVSDHSCFLINAVCNWMEPKASPFNSRQRIEYQCEGLHLISEQDNRGQIEINDTSVKINNPHFMTEDNFLFASGYGIDSYCNFLEALNKRFPLNALASINEYPKVAKVIDYVNNLL